MKWGRMGNKHTGSLFESFIDETKIDLYYNPRLDVLAENVVGTVIVNLADVGYSMVLTDEWILIGAV